MAKRPDPGKCVYCLRDSLPRTWDHVFPQSWYPETTEANIERWKVPACECCNSKYSALEQDLMLRIGLCISPDALESLGIDSKVMRSLNPNLAKNERDRRARQAKRDQVIKSLLTGTEIPTEGIYPGFEEKWGRPPEEQSAVLVPQKSIYRLVEKIVRGLVYIEDGQFVEPPYFVHVLPLRAPDAIMLTARLDRFGKIHACGPGIVVRRAVAADDGLSAIYDVTIWGKFQTYAVITTDT